MEGASDRGASALSRSDDGRRSTASQVSCRLARGASQVRSESGSRVEYARARAVAAGRSGPGVVNRQVPRRSHLREAHETRVLVSDGGGSRHRSRAHLWRRAKARRLARIEADPPITDAADGGQRANGCAAREVPHTTGTSPGRAVAASRRLGARGGSRTRRKASRFARASHPNPVPAATGLASRVESCQPDGTGGDGARGATRDVRGRRMRRGLVQLPIGGAAGRTPGS